MRAIAPALRPAARAEPRNPGDHGRLGRARTPGGSELARVAGRSLRSTFPADVARSRWQTRGMSDHSGTGTGTHAETESLSTAEFLLDARAVIAAIETVIDGKRQVIETAVTVLLAEGHLLMEDVPGVGKTMLARALARSVDCSVSRIQFTPDLLPADITGVSIYNQSEREFEFKPGPVFANIVIGDEINRASPKTQSALLESMEERQVTVDGASYALPDPFTVIATQNPIEMEAPTRSRRRSATGSRHASRWATPTSPRRPRCCARARPGARSTGSRPS